jgi:hypothetical protein
MPKNDEGWSLILAQTHLSLKDAVAFKMFIMNYWKSKHPGQDIDFLAISHNEALLKGLVALFKKHQK